MNYIVSIPEGKAHEVSSSQCSPLTVTLLTFLMWKLQPSFTKGYKKRRGSIVSLAPIPFTRPSHCPLIRISNAKQPTFWNINIHYGTIVPNIYIRRQPPRREYTLLYIKGNSRRNINITYANVFCCITAVSRSKVAKFGKTDR